MVDVFSEQKRSWIMGRVKGRDTKPEMLVRSLLHRMGFRFRLHRKDLPGNPDIVLPRYKKVIFVHGCFWHRHTGCRYATSPKTHTAFWKAKFSSNVSRDRRNRRELKKMGWAVLTVWQCELKNPKKLTERLNEFLAN